MVVETSSSPPPSTSVVTSLQVKSTDLCRSYFSALGVLQNEARPAPLGEDEAARAARLQGMQALIDDLAAGVVTAHREVDGLIDELSRRVSCDEPDALRRLTQAQAAHAEVTEQLRERVTRTGARAEPAAPFALQHARCPSLAHVEPIADHLRVCRRANGNQCARLP